MPSRKSKADHALAIIKAGISAIPSVGGPIASLIGDYVPTATQRSIDIAIDTLKHKLKELNDRIDANAVDKDEFAELFKSCYLIIIRTQQEKKITAAVNLLSNILLRNGDTQKLSFTELDHFARCLEALSIGAIEALGHAVDLARKSVPKKHYESEPFEFGFSQLQSHMQGMDAYLLMGLIGELNSVNLIHLAGTPTISMRKYSNYPIQLTPLGVRFCQYLLEG